VPGGTVGNEDISIIIPAGAFSSENEISIYEEPEDDVFGENTVSGLYKISGLPDNFSKPIELKIKYSGELSDESYLAVGTTEYEIINDDSSIVYALYTATDSSGYIIGELPINSESALAKANSSFESSGIVNEIFTVGTSGYKKRTTQNFNILYPSFVEGFIDRVETIFENNLGIIRDELGINFFPNGTPGFIVIRNQENLVKPQFQLVKTEYIQAPLSLFNVSSSSVIGDAVSKGELNIAAAKTLLWRENKYRVETGNTPIYLWYEFAIYAWIEELFTYSDNYKYPESFSEVAMQSFSGFHFGSYNFPFAHGVGMASVIKYLTDDKRFGKAGIGTTLENVSPTSLAAETIINTMEALKTEWWPDYFKKFIGGDIYKLSSDFFINNAHHEWSIDTIDDTLKIFDSDEVGLYPDLSAKLFKIDVNYSGLAESQNLILSMKGPVTEDGLSLVVFGIKNGETVYLETAHAQDFEIPKLKEYYDNNMRQFLVCLVNSLGAPPYTSESNIDLTINITSDSSTGGGGNSDFDYNYCEMQLFSNKFYEREDGSTFEQENTDVFSVEGEMIGNRFVANFEYYNFADTVEITLNETGDYINLLNWIKWYTQDSPSSTQITEVEANNIPIYDSNQGIYKVSGNQTCITIGHYSYYQNFQGSETTVKDMNCNENSYLEVKLYKRD
jgi:hypothetical protein